MSLVIVGVGSTSTITQSETDNVTFLGAGTLDIAGTAASPIIVTLSQVSGLALLDTVNISDADVSLGGVAGVSALVDYNIGSGGTLRIQSSVGIAAGTTVNFTAADSHLVLANGLNLSVLGGIAGFGPGRSIDVGSAATSLVYSDNAGIGTGGTLTLLNSGGGTVATLTLSDGEFVPANFSLLADGNGGTLVDFATAFTSVTAAPGTADLGAGAHVLFQITTTNPVSVAGGTPTLALNDGGAASYDAASSTATTLVFRYTVQPGQNTADLAVTGVALNGAVMADAAGGNVNLAASIGNPAGTLQIDTLSPTVTAVSMLPGTGDLLAGQIVAIDVNVSEAVTVGGGLPTLELSDGGTATYDAAHSTATTLAFTHTVQAGQYTPDLAVTGAQLNGAVVADGAGNGLDLGGAVGNPAGILQIGTAPATGPQNPTPSGPTGNVISPTTIDVYRFFDRTYGTHFYTSDASEAQSILQTRPDLVPEGPGGVGLQAVSPASNDPNAVEVFRFFDTVHGTHFFTASAAERDTIVNTRSDLVLERSSSFYEHAVAQPGDVAVYRFFDSTYGTHFYTDSASERASLIATRPDMIAEGVGFYEPQRNPAV